MIATITLEDLAISASIGCLEHEKQVTQTILISLSARVDVTTAAVSDHIDDAVNYAHMAQFITELAQAKHYHLVEHLAHTLIEQLQHTFPIQSLKLSIRKPHALVNAKAVGVTVSV